MEKRTDNRGGDGGRKPGVVPERPKDLLAFWARSKRSRAVATCYAELWQERHKQLASDILEFVRTHPGCDCRMAAERFPDVYEAVIVALVLGPVRVNSDSKHAASDDDEEEVSARPSEMEDRTPGESGFDMIDDDPAARHLRKSAKSDPGEPNAPPGDSIPW